jgi:hypothetical protein
MARKFDTPESGVYLRSTISREVARFKFRRFVMALWNDQTGREKSMPEPAPKAPEKVAVLAPVGEPSPRPVVTQNRADASTKESVISAGLIIEGKIEGAGHVRIAGEFKGDVNVKGNLTAASSMATSMPPPVSNYWRRAYSTASSRPARSPWRRVHACVAKRNSVGTRSPSID